MQGHAESAETLQQFCPYQNQDFFSAYLSYKQESYVVYIIFWAWRPADILWPIFLIKAAQPENLFSLKVFFLYISNLCQPAKQSYVFSQSKGAVSYKKERTN